MKLEPDAKPFQSAPVQPELWVINGRDPVLFRIPFWVVWRESTAEMEAAVPLLRIQKEAIVRILSLSALRMGQTNRWKITDHQLDKIATRATHPNPELSFSWGQPRPMEHRKIEGKPERTEFLESLYAAGIGESPEQLAYFWTAFCNHAAQWMINKEKPVDMIFFRLYNSPYRRNWKLVLAQRFPRLGTLITGKGKMESDYAIDRSGFKEELLNLDLLAFNRKDRTCYRHVEVEHTRKWWKIVHQAELQRLTRRGPYGYADYFMDSVRRFHQTAIRLYKAWLTQMARPCVADVEGGYDGSLRFMPNHLEGGMCYTSRKYHALPVVLRNKPPRFTPASREIALPETNGSLPALPAVQPEVKDLRNGHWRPEMDESENPKT